MTRKSYVQVNGVLYEKGTEPHGASEKGTGPTILPDLPDFVSPIDGRAYSGRTGLREHCSRHNVVPNADLRGLPVLKTNSDFRRPEEVRRDKQARVERIAHEFSKHYR